MLPVGYLPCTQDPPEGRNMARVLDEIMAEAQPAEASGWDGCFITEHHQQPDGYLPNPLLVAGWSGCRHNELRLALAYYCSRCIIRCMWPRIARSSTWPPKAVWC